ncbi:MAG: bifunctional nuclease family protein, partial [Gemmatimonadetes bacterium]|nr:bifunctional nuclease family protein [Gemmatimonadota bacterium]
MEVQRVQVSSRSYHRVVLRAKQGDANLHIVIGPAEARAISMAHRGQKPARPLSYDMARALLDEAGARIEQVAIIDLQDGIYYAEIHVLDEGGQERIIDSRPSDAIALAL